MTPKEALKTKYVGSGDNGEMLLAYTGEQVEIFKNAFTELEELKRDVKRFMEIFNISDDSMLWDEHNRLVKKLSKVGTEE